MDSGSNFSKTKTKENSRGKRNIFLVPLENSPLPDSKLVRLSLENAAFFAQIVQKYEKSLLRYLLRISNISREEAEDLLQEIFVKIYQNLRDFDSSLKFSSWIYRIAHNETISAWRKKSVRGEKVDLEKAEAAQLLRSTLDIAAEVDDRFLVESVREILRDLPPKYREILVLRFLENKDYSEISDILRRPMGSVATLISRAKKHFERAARAVDLAKFLEK